MNRLTAATNTLIALCFFGVGICPAQSMDDLNLQVHGYATQGLVYSSNNNWDTTNSTDGSAAWTEAVVNLTVQPQPRLRIGMQARYSLLGAYGNSITLDWAEGDFKVNEKLGLRVGKVKTPVGLLNDTQDVDPVQLWVLLPQAVYTLSNRNSLLAHYGAVVYGAIPLGESFGKLTYHAFGGARVLAGDDGFFQFLRDTGLTLPNGCAGPVVGAGLTWNTPVQGLIFGATDTFEHPSGDVAIGPMRGTIKLSQLYIPYFFTRYERNKLMVAGEYNRIPLDSTIQFPGSPAFVTHMKDSAFYVMASYKLSQKVNAGLYYGSFIDRKAAFTSSRYQKDWALSGRYDLNPYLYLKLEQHIIDGTALGYSTSNNADGLKPNSRMTMLKLGVSF